MGQDRGVVRRTDMATGSFPQRGGVFGSITDRHRNCAREDAILLLKAQEVEEMTDKLSRRLADSSVPTVPQVAMRVIELVEDPKSTIHDFAEVIRTDQALTGRMLRMVNSAAFGQRNPVTTIDRAIILLGLERTKALSLGFHLSRGLSSDSSARRLWTQSIFRAWLAFHLVERIMHPVAGEGFIIGLMLDAGIPLMPRLVGDSYLSDVDQSGSPEAQYRAECERLPFTHIDVIRVLAKLWRLPKSLAQPIERHHIRPGSLDTGDPASVLHAAAYFVGNLALDGVAAYPTEPALPELSSELFGLDSDAMRGLIARARHDFVASIEMFSNLIDQEMSLDDILDRANEQLAVSQTERAPDSQVPVRVTHRVEASRVVVEIESNGPRRVVVTLADLDGNRVLSEEIDPERCTPQHVRDMLMLERADEEIVREILRSMRRLAA